MRFKALLPLFIKVIKVHDVLAHRLDPQLPETAWHVKSICLMILEVSVYQ
jgi:hypothetical protein